MTQQRCITCQQQRNNNILSGQLRKKHRRKLPGVQLLSPQFVLGDDFYDYDDFNDAPDYGQYQDFPRRLRHCSITDQQMSSRQIMTILDGTKLIKEEFIQ